MTETTLNNDFKDIITSRHSVRVYDPTVTISRVEMTEILEEATLAPSSVNLQPWRFLVIDSPEGKSTLEELAPGNKNQVTTSSAVVAVFGDMNAFENADEIMSTDVERGYMPQEIKDQVMANYTDLFGRIPAQAFREMILIDGGLVSMQLMLSARARGYDTNPIGGYDKSRIAEAFGMEKERYVPVMLISVGKATKEPRRTSRLPVDRIAEWK
ncbi:nitroreductase family protein [Paenibacillus crassostreae]|uniref:NAD(P)H nitroreductase n=1 Tax=Paenibacillus crassostreae TaxID=1763538 RepID=A0A167F8D3_9BACL|nr:nitroreductase family protein [Paenibacillus crassostreae]AOZ90933.1 nitroreductase family protein [Paenibacillus crassostreae]OAB76300.1 NAD(P)H nitroreductase [Paenibacillus crassostreae]